MFAPSFGVGASYAGCGFWLIVYFFFVPFACLNMCMYEYVRVEQHIPLLPRERENERMC